MSAPPDWWRIVAAARYLGVAPWDLAQRPVFWVDVAHEAMSAEAHAADMHRR